MHNGEGDSFVEFKLGVGLLFLEQVDYVGVRVGHPVEQPVYLSWWWEGGFWWVGGFGWVSGFGWVGGFGWVVLGGW